MKVNIEVQELCYSALRGIPLYILNLVQNLVKRKHENTYSVSFFDYGKERNNRGFIDNYLGTTDLDGIYECNEINYKDLVKVCLVDNFASSLKNYCDYFKMKPDLYHFTYSASGSYMLTKDSVVTIHDLMPMLLVEKKYWSSEATNAFTNGQYYIAQHKEITIIADSECTKRDIVNYLDIGEERVFVIPLGYDKSKHFHDKNKSVLSAMGINCSYILYLGELDLRKGIFDILKAFNIIKNKYKGLKLVLSGKKETIFGSRYEDKIKGISLENVVFTGYVNDEQKRVLLSSAEIFLFPSEYEGFGLPVLEAMACGSPVITTNVSSLPEVGGDAVMYVSPNQPEELAEAIKKFLDSKSLREEYIQKGYQRAKLFSWDKTAALTEEVYKIHYQRVH